MSRKVNLPAFFCAFMIAVWLIEAYEPSRIVAQQPTATATVTPGLPPPMPTPTHTLTPIPTIAQPLVSTPIDHSNISSIVKGRSWQGSIAAISSLLFIADRQLVTTSYFLDRMHPNGLTIWTIRLDDASADDSRFEDNTSLSTRPFVRLQLSQDETQLIALGDYTAIWNLDTGRFVAMVGLAGATAVAYDRFFIMGSRTGLISLWDVPIGRIERFDGGSLPDPDTIYTPQGFLQTAFYVDEPVNQIEIIPNSRDLLILTNQGRLKRYTLDYNLQASPQNVTQPDVQESPSTIVVHPEGGPRMVLHPSRPYVAYAGSHRDLVVYDYANDQHLGRFELNAPVACIAYNPTGTLLVTASVSYNSTLFILDAQTMELLREIQTNENITTCSFSPDGTMIATGSTNGFITIWVVK